jgi:hypothetical protein
MLVGPAVLLLVPFLNNLGAIVALLPMASSMGWTTNATTFAPGTDLVRKRRRHG